MEVRQCVQEPSSCAYSGAKIALAKPNRKPVNDNSSSKKVNKGKWKCRRCPKRFETKGGLNIHLRQHNPELFLLTCPDCSFLTYQKGNYLKHTLIKHGKDADGQEKSPDINCSQCSFKAYTPEQLKSHVLRKHNDDKTENIFKCQQCEYSTVEKAALVKHIDIIHKLKRDFKCAHCTFRSQTSSGLARHERSHTETRPHICHLCTMAYADKKRLREHIMKHNDVKPFVCQHCSYATNRKDNLKIHIKRNHLPP